MVRTLTLGILALSCTPGFAQDAMGLLREVAANVSSIKTYEIEQIQHRSLRQNKWASEDEIRQHIFGAWPGKYRHEILGVQRLTILDGQQRWEYDKENNEYTRTPGPARNWRAYLMIEVQRIATARIVRQEAVELESGPVMCTVVEATRKNNIEHVRITETYWIDTQRNLSLKKVETWQHENTGSPPSTNVFTFAIQKISINQPLPDSLFHFTPPEGAVEVSELNPGRRSALEGKKAPDFQLEDAAGSPVTPATLHGSVAVLRFCLGDARDDALPFLELLHRNLTSEGVVVLAVARSPEKDWTQELAREGYSIATAIDPGGAAVKALGISSPSYAVLGRDGTVLYVRNGSNGREQRDIVRVLREAGVW